MRVRVLRVGQLVLGWTARLRYVESGGESGGERRRAVRLRVWDTTARGQLIDVLLVSASRGGPWGLANDDAFPTPRLVRALVDRALAAGWRPGTGTGVFPAEALAAVRAEPGGEAATAGFSLRCAAPPPARSRRGR